MVSLICFHDLAVEIQIGVLAVLFLMALCLLRLKGFWAFGLDRHRLEFLWTVIPFLIIMLFAIPSLTSLYFQAAVEARNGERVKEAYNKELELYHKKIKLAAEVKEAFGVVLEVEMPNLPSFSEDSNRVILATGRQWYWDYRRSITLFKTESSFNFSLSSHILQTADVFHLFSLDQWLYLPNFCRYTFVVTSGDVLHSFALPSLGVKIDAVPGKDNIVQVSPVAPGLYFGNCSEICGVNHRVMPIGLIVDSLGGNKPRAGSSF